MKQNEKILVTYFTASEGRVTEGVARRLAEALQADVFQIKPKEPYTKSDINWINPLARCNKEKLGKKEVEVEGKVENMSEYDLIFIGFPIWYGGAPNVVYTFVKGYDLSGKKLVLFATSGASGIGRSAEKLKPYVSETARILDAKLWKGKAGAGELKAWAEQWMD